MVYQKEVLLARLRLQICSWPVVEQILIQRERGGRFGNHLSGALCSGANMLQPGVSKYDFAAGRSHIKGRANKVILSRRVISMVLITIDAVWRIDGRE